MTATITERPTQTVETTAAATTTQASAAGTQTDANRLTFAVAMIAVMFASSVLAAITMGVGIYTGINLLEAR